MTSQTLSASEALVHDIGEELSFSDLFDDFPSDADQGHHLHDGTQHPESASLHLSPDTPGSDPSAPSPNHSPPTPTTASQYRASQDFPSLDQVSNPGHITAPSPRIEITPSADFLSSPPLEPTGPIPSPRSEALGPYRDQPCVSPASSNCSPGWPIEACSPSASPIVSPANGGGGGAAGLSALDLCPGIQGIAGSFSAHSSPGTSPRTSITEETFLVPQHHRAASPSPRQRSRSVSPKRPYDQEEPLDGGTPVKQRSRSPSPIPAAASATQQQHQHGAFQPPHYQALPSSEHLPATGECSPSLLDDVLGSLISPALPRGPAPATALQEGRPGTDKGCVYVVQAQARTQTQDGWGWNTEQLDGRRIREGAEVQQPSETLYVLPHIWAPCVGAGHQTFSGLPVAPVSPLEWPLPSHSGPYELVIQQQPRSHHRAHYETEGSRGPVKTPGGGHPVVQLVGYGGGGSLALQVFIGTAEGRVPKPHSFYQVHRILGKTVTMGCRERLLNGTKVLEVALEPKNHMTALNADIEQRSGRPDAGRKNTRVRLVFRVHIPQAGGSGLISLQVASQPIECSQRPAQELPVVEQQDLGRCSVLGGPQMVLTGKNYTSDSKVIFSEKTQDPTVLHAAKVNFYVVNGKKKCSQPQHFVYTPLKAIKTEPFTSYHMYSRVDPQALELPHKSLHSDANNLDSQSKAHTLSPILYHVTNPDYAAVHEPTARYHEEEEEDDEEELFYPYRTNTLKNTDPDQFYHAWNQQHQGSPTTGCFPVQRHPTAGQHQLLYTSLVLPHLPAHHPSLSAHCLNNDNTAVLNSELRRLEESYRESYAVAAAAAALPEASDLFGACCLVAPRPMSYTHTTVGPLGTSPPTQTPLPMSAQRRREADKMCASRLEPCEHPPLTQRGGVGSGRAWAGVVVERGGKAEQPAPVCLEDVNDIIKRDMGARSGGAS
ncbi:hypothetical protein CRUP_023844 [Coryphaenoides rupestris]|nr:hypothetical protein CRUP_023844 [Coryphaenoides rupestris]